MTRSFWRFAATALMGTIVVATLLAVAYGRLTLRNLTELGAEQNSALARALLNAERVPLEQLLGQTADLTAAELRRAVAASNLPAILAGQTAELSVVKVKVLDARGVTVFSTDAAQIGETVIDNRGVLAALSGEIVNDIVRRDTPNEYERVIERRDLIHTYMPVRGADDAVLGVFELYSYVTPLLARIAATQRGIIVGVIATLGSFYVLLVWLYRRRDRDLVRERAITRGYLEEIEAANATLEERVAERSRELEESERFLQTALDGVPDPAVVVDSDYCITSMNEAARAAFDADQELPLERRCYEVLYGRDVPCVDPDYPCTLKCGKATIRVEDRVDSHGEQQQIQIRTTPLRGPNGGITGAIAVLHNLDEREQAAYRLRREKERAEAASEVKSEFVAMMSHEIRTPMNAVLGMTDLLRLTELTRKQQGYIQTIQSSGNMLLSLVDNILDFSRLGAGALTLRKRDFNVIELLEQVLEVTGYNAYSKDLELGGMLDGDMQLRVCGDKNRLRQILVNLVSNAVKFSEQGEIIVRGGIVDAASDAARLSFSVSDQRIGMSDSVKQRLFTPFATVDETMAGRQQGSGLGLAICRQLVEFMGGEIGIDSSPGEGTRIWFEVPVERRPAPDSALDIPTLHGKRVLTVCGSASIGEIICSYARAWGMSCDCASDPGEALERLREESRLGRAYGLLIVDDNGGGGQGLVLARQVRECDDIRLLPVVLLRSIARPLEPGEISSIGRICCVNKPVLPSELRLALYKISGAGAREHRREAHGAAAGVDIDDLRILIAEDNLVNRRVLTGMLNSLERSADCVADGPSVLQALDETPYDVVLMDCQMPGLDGEKVTELIRGDQERFPVQPVIVAITADASVEHRAACLKAGMDDFIAKPLRLARLERGLERWQAMVATRRVAADTRGITPPGQIAISGNEALLDHLRDRTAGQESTFLSGYIDLFLEDTSRRLDGLVDAFDRNDLATLRRQSHALKGACLEFGVERMGRYCDELQHSAVEENVAQVPDLLRNLRLEFDRVRPVFEAEKSALH